MLFYVFFLNFTVQIRPDTMTQEEHPNDPIHHLFVTSFSTNYNKTHKSRLRYEIRPKYDLYKIVPKNITKNYNM